MSIKFVIVASHNLCVAARRAISIKTTGNPELRVYELKAIRLHALSFYSLRE